jgi:hypothetical protein
VYQGQNRADRDEDEGSGRELQGLARPAALLDRDRIVRCIGCRAHDRLLLCIV